MTTASRSDLGKTLLDVIEVSRDYMRSTPCGQLPYPKSIAIYTETLDASKPLAELWANGVERPPRHPAILDANWWAAVPLTIETAEAIADVDLCREFLEKYPAAGLAFSQWLKPQPPMRHRNLTDDYHQRVERLFSKEERITPAVQSSPALHMVYLDVVWGDMAAQLALRWNPFEALRRLPAVRDIWKFTRELRRAPNAVSRVVVESDVACYRRLFDVFDFSNDLRVALKAWLDQAEEEVKTWPKWQP